MRGGVGREPILKMMHDNALKQNTVKGAYSEEWTVDELYKRTSAATYSVSARNTAPVFTYRKCQMIRLIEKCLGEQPTLIRQFFHRICIYSRFLKCYFLNQVTLFWRNKQASRMTCGFYTYSAQYASSPYCTCALRARYVEEQAGWYALLSDTHAQQNFFSAILTHPGTMSCPSAQFNGRASNRNSCVGAVSCERKLSVVMRDNSR